MWACPSRLLGFPRGTRCSVHVGSACPPIPAAVPPPPPCHLPGTSLRLQRCHHWDERACPRERALRRVRGDGTPDVKTGSQDAVLATCLTDARLRGHWGLLREAGQGAGGAPLTHCQGSRDPSTAGSRCPVSFSVQTRPWLRPEPRVVPSSTPAGKGPLAPAGVRRGPGAARGGGPRSRSDSRGRGAGNLVRWLAVGLQQISRLCVFATPFYKGKHNLKYDYLVL